METASRGERSSVGARPGHCPATATDAGAPAAACRPFRSGDISAARAPEGPGPSPGQRRPRRRRPPGQRASGPPKSGTPASSARGTRRGRSPREAVAHLSASAAAPPRRCPPRRTGRPRRAAPPASAHRQPAASWATASAPRRKSRLRRGDADAARPETRSGPAPASAPEAPPTTPARAAAFGLAAALARAAPGRVACCPPDRGRGSRGRPGRGAARTRILGAGAFKQGSRRIPCKFRELFTAALGRVLAGRLYPRLRERAWGLDVSVLRDVPGGGRGPPRPPPRVRWLRPSPSDWRCGCSGRRGSARGGTGRVTEAARFRAGDGGPRRRSLGLRSVGRWRGAEHRRSPSRLEVR